MAIMMENKGDAIEKLSASYNGASPSLIVIDWSKKRKLEEEHLTLPSSKLKCIIRSSERCKEGTLRFEPEGIESSMAMYACNFPLETKDSGSNRINGSIYSKLGIRSDEYSSGSDCKSSICKYGMTMPIDEQGETESSATSATCHYNTSRNNLYSASIINKRKSNDREAETLESLTELSAALQKRLHCVGVLDEETIIENLKDSTQGSELLYTEDYQLLDLGISYADLIASEGYQHRDDYTLLYLSDASSPICILTAEGWCNQAHVVSPKVESNGVASRSPGLHILPAGLSGGTIRLVHPCFTPKIDPRHGNVEGFQVLWYMVDELVSFSFYAGALPREKKPTIDQEFEQYFSSLML